MSNLKFSKEETNIMLKIVAALFFVTYCVEGQTELNVWGSRIITQKTGSVTLKLEYKTDDTRTPKFMVAGKTFEEIAINTNENKCKTTSLVEWSSPCIYDRNTGTFVITVKDVTAQDEIIIFTPLPSDQYISIVFAPGCKFPKPQNDEVVINMSVPLSRFVEGQSNVPLTFAVMGSESQSEVELFKNGKSLCQWKGIEYRRGEGCRNKNLEKDSDNNMRVLKMNFPIPDDRDYYTWKTKLYPLSVTVDAKQAGELPEPAECKDIIPDVTKTTSAASGFAVTNMIVVNLGFIVILMYLGK